MSGSGTQTKDVIISFIAIIASGLTQVMKKIFKIANISIMIGTSFLVLVSGCQQVIEWRVTRDGVSVPRNHREKVIFDYFYALKQKRYRDAYSLRVPEARGTYETFVKKNAEYHNQLPVIISIANETKIDETDSSCGYVYTVNIAQPGSSHLMSGQVSLEPNPKEPGTCQVGYNSAFGSL
jgi:hypothetical protein